MGPFVYGAHWSSGHTNAAGAPFQSKFGGDCASAELSLISKLISCSQFHISCRISQGGAAGSPEHCRSTKETVSYSRLQTTPAPGTQIHELQPGASRKPCRKQRNWFNWDSCRQVESPLPIVARAAFPHREMEQKGNKWTGTRQIESGNCFCNIPSGIQEESGNLCAEDISSRENLFVTCTHTEKAASEHGQVLKQQHPNSTSSTLLCT